MNRATPCGGDWRVQSPSIHIADLVQTPHRLVAVVVHEIPFCKQASNSDQDHVHERNGTLLVRRVLVAEVSRTAYLLCISGSDGCVTSRALLLWTSGDVSCLALR